MSKLGVHQALNRLLTVIERSLPLYLSYTTPWTRAGDEKATAALKHIVADQQQLAGRIADVILEKGPIDLGEYPIGFYDLHDLSLEYLLTKLVEFQKKSVAQLERLLPELQEDRVAAALGEEALGASRGHLETLEELVGKLKVAATS
jgi:hypothetical protein